MKADIYRYKNDIRAAIHTEREKGNTIGFVPTMGALHQGHISLLSRSVAENDISVSSVFVNPIQFNNKEDLLKYPRTLEDDISKLEAAGCNMVFAPSVEEMYPDEVDERFDFGHLENVMEGASRPGHFNGVGVVVSRLFDICMPHKAYFGEKDYQQFMIIKELAMIKDYDIEIIACPIIREADGLAMSSRNVRLKDSERLIAPVIFETLEWIKKQADRSSLQEVLSAARQKLSAFPEIKVEYLEVVDERTLSTIESWESARSIRAFIALFLGEVRLIDNLKIR